MKAASRMHFFPDSLVSFVFESSSVDAYTTVPGFGFLCHPIFCTHAVVRAGFLSLMKKLLFSKAPLGMVL